MIALILKYVLLVKNNLQLIATLAVCAVVLYVTVSYFVLKKRLEIAESQLQESRAAVQQMKLDIVDISKSHIELAAIAKDYQNKKELVSNKLERRGKKSLGELASKKAGLVQKAINSGSNKAMKCLETVSAGGDC